MNNINFFKNNLIRSYLISKYYYSSYDNLLDLKSIKCKIYINDFNKLQIVLSYLLFKLLIPIKFILFKNNSRFFRKQRNFKKNFFIYDILEFIIKGKFLNNLLIELSYNKIYLLGLKGQIDLNNLDSNKGIKVSLLPLYKRFLTLLIKLNPNLMRYLSTHQGIFNFDFNNKVKDSKRLYEYLFYLQLLKLIR